MKKRLIFIFILLFCFINIPLTVEAAELIKEYKTVQVKEHKVKTKENLWSIAQSYQLKMEKIIKFNQLDNKKIKQGQKIKIPYFKTVHLVKVEPEETLWSISQQFNTTVERIKLYNNLTNNSIYPGQYLIIVKDNPEAFYTEEEIKDRKKLYLKGKRDYWVLPALDKLNTASDLEKNIVKEVPNSDTVTQLRLTLMLEEILAKLKEVNNKNLEAKLEELTTAQTKLKEITTANKEQIKLNKQELKKLNNTINLFEQELSKLGIKTKQLDKKMQQLIAAQKAEPDYTKTVLTGAHKLNWQQTEEIIGLNQIIFLNWHNIISDEKKVDFFFQTQRNHRQDQQETLTFGTESFFKVAAGNTLNFKYAYRHPFDSSLGTQQTYFDANWQVDTPYFDSKIFGAQTNIKLLKEPKTSSGAEMTLKTNAFNLNLNYQQRDLLFIPLFVTGEPILDKSYLIEEEKKYSGRLIFPIQQIVNLRLGVQGIKPFNSSDQLGGTVGINLHGPNNNWNWKFDYVTWEQESQEKYRLISGINLDTDYLVVAADLNYIKPNNEADNILKVKSEVVAKLTDFINLNLVYNKDIVNPAFEDYQAGVTINF